MEWLEIALAILTGLATTIPLVIKLIEYVKKAIKEKNWNKLLELVMKLIAEAEVKFDNGKDRKDYVMMAVKAASDTVNYDIDMEAVSALIDSLCDLTKKVNVTQTQDNNAVV